MSETIAGRNTMVEKRQAKTKSMTGEMKGPKGYHGESESLLVGCGNFGILNAIKKTLAGMQISPEKILMVSGIGQASPTSRHGVVTKAQCQGVACHASNPLALALSQGAGFVARGYCGEIAHLSQLIREGISYPGFSLIDILQVCVSFNKENTYTFYKDRVYTLDKEEYKADDLHQALDSESICLPLFWFHGIFFTGT